MPSPGLAPNRVARVLYARSRRKEPPYEFASGYRISSRLILTVAHTLAAEPVPEGRTPYKVDLDGDENWRDAREIWRDTDRDIALLRLEHLLPGEVPGPVRLGRVDGSLATTLGVRTMGYPDYAEFTARGELWRGREELPGTIRTAETGRPGTLRVHLDRAPRSPTGPREGSPWEGMSGAPVFSRSSNLLLGIVRDHHLPAGTSTLEIASLDAIDDPGWLTCLDEAGIDPVPRTEIPDEWEGVGLQPYASYLEERIVISPGLDDRTLPFVDPGEEEEYAPSNLLAGLTNLTELAASGSGSKLGTLVVGIPGAGKTRLLAETATRAAADGWRVLHLGEPMLEDAWERIRGLPGRVLLVVEDISELVARTPYQVIERIRGEVARHGPGLALLAESRTGALGRAGTSLAAVEDVLRWVPLPYGGGYHDRIRRQVVRTLAEDAADLVGERRMEKVCGSLPALSVVFARYYNDQVRSRRALEEVIPFDTPGVGGWIREVLRTEELTTAGVEPAGPGPDPRLIAAARVAVIAPHSSQDITGQLAHVLGTDSPTPAGLLKTLAWAGLWSIDGGRLRMVHDAFTDHLLRELVCEVEPATGVLSVRTDRLDDVLAAGLLDHRALGNLARAVERLRDVVDEERFGAALTEAVEQWCSIRLVELERVLTESRAGDTLALLLEAPTWQGVIRRFQDRLAHPWLKQNFRKPAARDAIAAAAAELNGGYGYLTGWLMANSDKRRAAYVFRRIASVESSNSLNLEWTADLALDHLTNQSLHRDASFVLQPLLDTRSTLHLPRNHPHLGKLIGWARRWLEKYASQQQATYVAGPLVLRPELHGAELVGTVRTMLDRVAGHRELASYVYGPVLLRQRRFRDLPEPLLEQAITDAAAWLEEDEYGLLPAAGYVLPELIAARIPWKKTLSRVLVRSWKWLDRHGERPEAGRLIATLLDLARSNRKAEERLEQAERELLADHVRAWLDSPGPTRNAWRKSVLGKVLSTGLLDDDADSLRRYATEALQAYDNTPTSEMARTVLEPLLKKKALPSDLADQAIDRAWGRLDPDDEHAAYLLTPLVRRPLDPERRGDVLEITLAWLSTFPSGDGSFRLLTAALRSQQNTTEDREKVADRAVAMLGRELLEQEGQLLVHTLCQHRTELPTVWNRFVGTACRVFDDEGTPRTAKSLLSRMLSGEDVLDDQVVARLHASCIDWCRDRPRSTQVLSLLPDVLASRRLSATERQRASDLGYGRLESRTETTTEGGKLLLALLRHGELDTTGTATVVDFSIRWLDRNEEPRKVIAPLVECLDQWLRRNPDPKPEQHAAISAHREALADRSARSG